MFGQGEQSAASTGIGGGPHVVDEVGRPMAQLGGDVPDNGCCAVVSGCCVDVAGEGGDPCGVGIQLLEEQPFVQIAERLDPRYEVRLKV
jgi:hypothetical protein